MMMLELHNVTIGKLVNAVSMTVGQGRVASVTGPVGSGKTTLLRAIMGFLPIDGGHISIDGELLTPQSAPYFRRFMAYVPQHLSVPEGYKEVPTDYMVLLERAVHSGKQLLIVDEPLHQLYEEEKERAGMLLTEALRQGMTVVAVNVQGTENIVSL